MRSYFEKAALNLKAVCFAASERTPTELEQACASEIRADARGWREQILSPCSRGQTGGVATRAIRRHDYRASIRHIDRMHHDSSAFCEIIDLGEVILEMRGRAMRGHGIGIFIKLIEHEPAWIIYVLPQVIAQVAGLRARRRRHAAQQFIQLRFAPCLRRENSDDLYI